jgi:hypothetical protein
MATLAAVLAGRLAVARRDVEAAAQRHAADGALVLLTPGSPPPSGTFAAVVSAGWLAGRADLPAAVGHLAGALAPGGRLFLLEPERPPGLAGAAGFLARPRPGVHLDRDVAGALWASGLRLVDADHLEVRGAGRALRRWLRAVACLPPTADYPVLAPAGGAEEVP